MDNSSAHAGANNAAVVVDQTAANKAQACVAYYAREVEATRIAVDNAHVRVQRARDALAAAEEQVDLAQDEHEEANARLAAAQEGGA